MNTTESIGKLECRYDISGMIPWIEHGVLDAGIIEECKSDARQALQRTVSAKIADGRKYQVEFCKTGIIENSVEKGIPLIFYKVWANIFLLNPEEALVNDSVVNNKIPESLKTYRTQSGMRFDYVETVNSDRIWKRVQ